jgi:hypothetical protein
VLGWATRGHALPAAEEAQPAALAAAR